MSKWVRCLVCLAIVGLMNQGAAFAADSIESVAKPAPASPLTPEESLKHFQIDPDCRIELVAAEPDVSAPVSIAFDEKGQLWVVEMHDYPNGPVSGEPGKSRIRVLTDEDGDGNYSNPRVFVDQLLFANSLMHWDGGVLVTTDGKLIYFKDTDHDGKSDLREVWFEGFATENPQLRCNHPTFGPDNWIYVANGLRNGKVRAVRPKWPQPAPETAKLGEPVDIAGRDFRFNPFTGECEAVSGYGQFGLTFDDEGNRYVCSNRNPCMKVIIEERHLKLNPNLAVPSVYEDISPAGEQSQLYPISRAWTTSNLHAGQFSAACGLIFYRGTALPKGFYGENFTCDPTGNLVHCDYWHQQEIPGSSMSSMPWPHSAMKWPLTQRSKSEFLASDETWFRPVNTAMGPDGALYVIDMYRAVIEHPDYMPTELKTRSDLSIGSERGRIWRIVRHGHGETERSHLLPSFPSESHEIVQQLAHSNGWHRDLAHRLLVERQSKNVEESLRSMLNRSNDRQGSTLALRTLSGLGLLKSQDLIDIIQRRVLARVAGLKVEGDSVSGEDSLLVSEAVGLSEHYVAQDRDLAAKLLELGSGDDAGAFLDRLHLTLGQLGEGEREKRIALAIKHMQPIQHQYEALGAGAGFPLERTEDHLSLCIALGEKPFLPLILKETPALGISFSVLTAVTRSASSEELADLFCKLVKVHDAQRILLMARTLSTRGITVHSLVGSTPLRQQEWIAFIENVIETVNASTKEQPEHPDDFSTFRFQGHSIVGPRYNSKWLIPRIQCLRFAPVDQVEPVLRRVLDSQTTPDVYIAALETASTLPDTTAVELMLHNLSQRTPAIRSSVIDGLLGIEPRITKLLDLIESNQISFLEIGQTRLASLQQVKNPEIQARLQKLIAANAPADRSKVLEEYQAALTHEHDPLRGRELFAKNCAICHKIGDIGVDVAPNISDSRVKTHAQLLVDILDPNRAIDNNYFSYTLVDTSGKVSTGIISSETSSSVTMKQPEGKTITVLRSEIEQLKPNGVSLMPVGFEKQLTVAQLADVISFIKNWRYLDGDVPKEVIK